MNGSVGILSIESIEAFLYKVIPFLILWSYINYNVTKYLTQLWKSGWDSTWTKIVLFCLRSRYLSSKWSKQILDFLVGLQSPLPRWWSQRSLLFWSVGNLYDIFHTINNHIHRLTSENFLGPTFSKDFPNRQFHCHSSPFD